MGGNKDGTSYRSCSQRSGGSGGGGGSVSETGALFPRLHVKETKQVGPRAPPRNKMALYEQFTFPSSRYQPPSMALPSSGRPSPTPITTPYASQRSSYEGSLFYGLSPSFGAMPWMPYAPVSNTSTPAPQPSLNGSSGSTIVDGEADLRLRAGALGAESARQTSSIGGHGTAWASCQSNASGVSRRRPRLDDASSAPMPPAKDGCSHETAADALGVEKSTWQPWHRRNSETANKMTRISVFSDCQVESSGLASLRTNRGANSVNEIGRHDEGAKKDVTRKGERKRHDGVELDVQDFDGVEDGKDRNHEARKSRFGDTDGNVIQRTRQGLLHQGEKKSSQADLDGGSKISKSYTPDNGDLTMAIENNDQGSSRRRRIISVEGRSPTVMRNVEKGSKEKADAPARIKVAEKESRKRANPSECKSSSFVDADDEVEIISGAEVSGRSDSEANSDGEDSDSEISDPQAPRKVRKLSSRSVVKLLGEQEFWRTRDLLQRQQKIFSEQVFELHRLIKVQQMLVLTADQVIDEETMGGAADAPKETSDPDHADEEIAAEEDDDDEGTPESEPVNSREAVAVVSESPETQEKDAEKPPDTCQSSTSHRARAQAPVVDPAPELEKAEASAMPSAGPGESTASWTYPMAPKSDANNWFGAAIPAPGGAFMYQPYPGAFHPSQPHAIGTYTGPYGPIVCAPGHMDVSGMTPYGMPRYEQRMDMMPEMYRYNSYQQQWPPAMLCPPVPSNPGAGWYGVPAPMPYMDPALRGSCGWYEEMTPGGPAHPSSSSSYPRPPPPGHATSVHGTPVPRAATFVMQPSPWTTDVSQSHHSGADGDKFGNQQVSWTDGNEAGGQTASSLAPQRPANNFSGSESGNPGFSSVGGGFQRPPPRLAAQESIGTHSAGTSKGIGLGWGLTASGNDFLERESNAAEAPIRTHSVSKEERKQKKSRGESRPDPAKETREADEEEERQYAESPDGTEAQRDALPLFPLVPVLNTPENRRLASQSSGVIKVVPRAMVAAAESAAEILLSIQKQRQG